MGECDELDLILDRLGAAFGPAQAFDEIWLFGGAEILLSVRWSRALGSYKIDLAALSRDACRPLTPDLLGTLGFPRGVAARDWTV